MTWWRRLVGDLKARNHLDTYALTAVVFTFAILSLVSDALDHNLRWAVLLSGVGLLIYRLTLAPLDRSAGRFALRPQQIRGQPAGPAAPERPRCTGVRAVGGEPAVAADVRTAPEHRTGPAERICAGGGPRPRGGRSAIGIAARQLDDSLEFPIQRLPQSLASTPRTDEPDRPGGGPRGRSTYRVFPYNPGFSLVLVDPETSHGRVIVEFHGFHNPSTSCAHASGVGGGA